MGFADDTFMFLKANNINISKCMQTLQKFSLAACLDLNIDKSTLINLSVADFDSLIWNGKRLQTGHIFRHLGYPIGVDVSNKMLIDWVLEKVKKKILYWKSDQWPLHVRLRIVQAILIPYLLYYLPLLDWKESHLKLIIKILMQFLWNKKQTRSMLCISWDMLCQPKEWGGLGILHLQSHLLARRATLLKNMLDKSAYWCLCLWEIISNGTVNFHGKWELDDWSKLFSHAPLKVSGRTSSMLIKSWKCICGKLIWDGRMRYLGNSLPVENVHWSFIFASPPALLLGSHSRYFF